MMESSGPAWAPAVGKTDTSAEAAEAMRGRADSLRSACLSEVVKAGDSELTADECAALIDESVLAVRPRFTELRAMRKIVNSGQRRKNGSGRNAVVWWSV